MSDQEVTGWVTKYALTRGLFVITGELKLRHGYKPYVYKDRDPHGIFYVDEEFFYNREDALKQAEVMRIKKIASLKKQIKKLENMEVE